MSWSSRRPRRARRFATTRRCSTRSSRIRRVARCISFPPKRSRRISSPSSTRCARRSQTGRPAASRTADPQSACTPTTATRRRTRAARYGRARRSCSATRTWCIRASFRTTRAGRSCSRTCASSSSTSCTPTAACSAVISATCSAACGASAVTTAPVPCSSARRRRSRTRASSRSGSRNSPSSSSRRAARRAARNSFCSSTRRSSIISSASGARI